MSSRSWLWSFVAVVVVLGSAGSAAAQPPSPLELVRGIREAGMPDLALEYLKEIEPQLAGDDKAAIPLERARCLLDAADDEPDEGTRTSMVGEAKEGFSTFLAVSGSHPRASEASLALAKLTSLEAKTQLQRARRMDIPDKDDPGYEEAVNKQRIEAEKARPLFLLASQRFSTAAKQIKTKLEDKGLDPQSRQALAREAFDADLAAAINQYYLADTYLNANAARTEERDKLLDEVREKFAELAKGPASSRTVWVARTWMAEVLGDQGRIPEMLAEFKAIMAVPALEASEGKRLVEFFVARREYLAAIAARPLVMTQLQAAEKLLRDWLRKYSNVRKPPPEVFAARYYLAFDLQLQGLVSQGKNPTPGATAQKYFAEAEKLYRTLAQSDHDYTARAAKYRMFVVRKIIGEADQPPSSYTSFEDAQMAALIQMAKLQDAENAIKAADKSGPDDGFWATATHKFAKSKLEPEVRNRKQRVIALLERARELAAPSDPPADVVDNLLRLVYFYSTNDQPYQAAVLGEHVARTIKGTGGKAALAGMMALNGYTLASSRIKAEAADPSAAEAVAAAAAAAKKVDRERAITIARFLDDKFPNDTATDTARHRLAILLNEDGRPHEAFEAAVKIRPGYTNILLARQLEGYLAQYLITTKDAPIPAIGKSAMFQRAVADLGKVAKPGPTAVEDDVRGYLSCRLRLASLYLTQSRVEDPALDAQGLGHDKALAIANEVLEAIPSFNCLLDNDKKVNIDGQELQYQGLDVRTRAVYVRCKALVDEKKIAEAAAAITPAIEDITKSGALYTDKMKQWAAGEGDGNNDPEALQKSKIASLAAQIDKTRQNIVMVGFKLEAVQGKKDEAVAMLGLLEKAGGSVEGSQAALENMGRELAVQIAVLKKENKAPEAKLLGDGLAELLKKISAIPNRTTSSTLFIGQTLYTVEQYDAAIEEFKKIPVPGLPKCLNLPPNTPWWTVDITKIPADKGDERKKYQDETRDYRFAQLYTAKALRGAGGPRLAEAEKLLVAAMGGPEKEKQGWGYSSLDIRKELAATYEGLGASHGANIKPAGEAWGKALKEWTTLFTVAKGRLEKREKGLAPEQEKKLFNDYYEAYCEVQRCLLTANKQLQAGVPQKWADTLATTGKRIKDMENTEKFAENITPEVAAHYFELFEKFPELKAPYAAAGGKFFGPKPKKA